MKIRRAIVLLLAIASPALATDYSVDATFTGKDGTGNAYSTLSAAIAAAPSTDAATLTHILIHPGTYKQQLTISQSNIALIGVSGNPADTIITDDLNAQTQKPAGGNYGTTGASSTFIRGNNVLAENLTFKNSTPYGGSQAVAIKTSADKIAFKHCVFTSFQDTLYVTGGRDYFTDCTINGSVDFIFGNATAVFDHCTIVSSHAGAVTAANTQAATPVGMVFLDCILKKQSDLPDHSVSLGRPWQYGTTDAAVVFIRCKMDSHITPQGWNPWDSRNASPAGDSRYGEFQSTDLDGKPLDISQRTPWSHQLTADQAAQFTPANIFGPADFWWKGGWPAIWGTRNHPPAAYTDWKPGGAWDPVALTAAPAPK